MRLIEQHCSEQPISQSLKIILCIYKVGLHANMSV